ncbi:PREDICTED: protein IQ-DOMAIN 1-like isoform X1 [Tarenaya hassleriana]|uniref:protein IQ-DOMAIN 1-like isoform X1 n=1 Tax=Tarenaya hassleriana TaxID=28532 RepID=UPI00053C26B4|nr:PREDICTED: protein IQ-DOMAIN 1-like isoform X1 [Tarenaya hassleriana]XP_010558272.1 PREDICTED: protein IQ-DOMAIN 1-like isoform X1 [Tarenaya hassleriana]
MGKKGKWFSNLKKAFSPDSMKFRHNVPQYHNGVISDPVLVETVKTSPPPFEVIVVQNKNECSSSADVSASAAADIPEVSSQSALEVVNCAKPAHITGKSIDEAATIMIQTAFRGYLARRALRALRGLVRLKSLMEEPVMKRQVANTLKCMQTLSHVQSQIQTRRIRMSEENQARQKQLLQKNAIELANLRNGDDWDDSLQSKEQVEANILSRYEAAMRRERALAYAYSHQQTWKNNTGYANPTLFMDPSNPTWGWSWLERWMAGRPWESPEKKNDNNDDRNSLVKSSINQNNPRVEITKSVARSKLNSSSAQPNTPSSARAPRKKNNFLAPPTPSRINPSFRKSKNTKPSSPDDDAQSMVSMNSGKNPRRSIAGSSSSSSPSSLSVRDNESLASSPARAKLKPQGNGNRNGGSDKAKATVKKRLSYHSGSSPAPPRPRRFSAPPKVENGRLDMEIAVNNRGRKLEVK